jgi:AraC family ethanolamine operon transcriptional activator
VFHDLDQVNEAISGSDLEFIQLKSGNLDIALDHISLDDLSIDVGAVNQPIRVMGGLDPGRFSIGVLTMGAQATWNGTHVDDSQLLLFPPGWELSGYASTMYGWTSLIIPPAWIDVIEQTASRANITSVSSFITSRPAPETLAGLRQAASNVLNLSKNPLTSPSEEWLLADLRNMLGGVLSVMDVPPPKVISQAWGHFIIAKRAESHMRERTDEPVSIDDLCVTMNVSRRYLEYAFADAFGTSPSRYLRLMRLNQVRNRLKASGGQTTVTKEALRLGFSHLSLFATQYKNTFGESPSQTLARATR